MPTLITKPCYWAEKNATPCKPTCAYCKGTQVESYNYEACGVDGCDYNVYGMAPSHAVKERCQSAKKPHCTCDRCF